MNATLTATCPRCKARPLSSHGELFCLVHGTIEIPMPVLDIPSREKEMLFEKAEQGTLL